MVAYPWHGNVRELKNAAERATFRTMAAQANGAPLGPIEVNLDILDPFSSPWRPAADLGKPAAPQPAPIIQVVEQKNLAIAAEINAAPMPGPDASVGPVDFQNEVSVFERRMLDAALAAEKGHQRKAADRLGLSYHQMRGLLRKYGYGRDEGEAADARDVAAN
jgi:psp operon transcriptional activator